MFVMTNGAFILFPRKPTENSGILNRLKPQEPCRKHHRLRLLVLLYYRHSPDERILSITHPVETCHPLRKHTKTFQDVLLVEMGVLKPRPRCLYLNVYAVIILVRVVALLAHSIASSVLQDEPYTAHLLTCAIQCKRQSGFDRIHNHTSLFLLLRSWCYLAFFDHSTISPILLYPFVVG